MDRSPHPAALDAAACAYALDPFGFGLPDGLQPLYERALAADRLTPQTDLESAPGTVTRSPAHPPLAAAGDGPAAVFSSQSPRGGNRATSGASQQPGDAGRAPVARPARPAFCLPFAPLRAPSRTNVLLARLCLLAAAAALAVLLLLACGGCSLTDSPAAAYVAGDHATFDAVAPEYSAYVIGDPALSTSQKERRLRTVATWRLRVVSAEADAATTQPALQPVQPLPTGTPPSPVAPADVRLSPVPLPPPPAR